MPFVIISLGAIRPKWLPLLYAKLQGRTGQRSYHPFMIILGVYCPTEATSRILFLNSHTKHFGSQDYYINGFRPVIV